MSVCILAPHLFASEPRLDLAEKRSCHCAKWPIGVHLRSEKTLQHYVVFEVVFDESLVARLTAADLPRNWRQSPPPPGLQRIGDAWIAEAASPALAVPSVIVPEESNYLLNPRHPEFEKLTVGRKQRVRFDPRLIRKTGGEGAQ